MATLFELKEEILKGRKVTRKLWGSGRYKALGYFSAHPEDIFADDWELEPLPKVKNKITLYQFIYLNLTDCNYYPSKQLYENKASFYKHHGRCEILKMIPHEIEVDEIEVDE